MRPLALAAALAWTLAPTLTHAQAPDARVFGAGFALGVGPAAATDYGIDPTTRDRHVSADVGSLELMVFLDDTFSVDVSIQLLGTLAGAARGELSWASTVYLDWSVGNDTRLVLGPGLGVAAHTGDPTRDASGLEARIGALLGMEALTTDHFVGFRLVTRPWLALGGGDLGFELGYGAMLEAAFLFYDF